MAGKEIRVIVPDERAADMILRHVETLIRVYEWKDASAGILRTTDGRQKRGRTENTKEIG